MRSAGIWRKPERPTRSLVSLLRTSILDCRLLFPPLRLRPPEELPLLLLLLPPRLRPTEPELFERERVRPTEPLSVRELPDERLRTDGVLVEESELRDRTRLRS